MKATEKYTEKGSWENLKKDFMILGKEKLSYDFFFPSQLKYTLVLHIIYELLILRLCVCYRNLFTILKILELLLLLIV